MPVAPWPFITTQSSLPRINLHLTRGTAPRDDERRLAEIDRAFRTVDEALAQIEDRLFLLENPPLGGMQRINPTVVSDVVANVWTQITGFSIPLAGRIPLDIPNNKFRTPRYGKYQVRLKMALSFDPAPAHRRIDLRVLNLSGGSGPVFFIIEKLKDFAIIDAVIPFQSSSDWQSLQYFSSAAITNITVENVRVDIIRVSN